MGSLENAYGFVLQNMDFLKWALLLILLIALAVILIAVIRRQHRAKVKRKYARDLPNRSVLITGCDSGFGEALVVACVAHGMTVFASVLNEGSIDALHKKCCTCTTTSLTTTATKLNGDEPNPESRAGVNKGGEPRGPTQAPNDAHCRRCTNKLHVFVMDITSDKSVKDGLTYVSERLIIAGRSAKPTNNSSNAVGVDVEAAQLHQPQVNPPAPCLDALVNNAGIFCIGYDEWLSVDDYETTIRVNTLGAVRVTHAFRPLIKSAAAAAENNGGGGGVGGRLVFMSSYAGLVATATLGPYNASKYALEAYADTVRRELAAYGVGVSIVNPYYHRTPLTLDFANRYEETWARAPPEIRPLYGDQFVQQLSEMYLKLAESSPTAEVVVAACMHAITSPWPKKRYRICQPGKKLQFDFLTSAPTALQDTLLDLNDRNAPKPLHALRK